MRILFIIIILPLSVLRYCLQQPAVSEIRFIKESRGYRETLVVTPDCLELTVDDYRLEKHPQPVNVPITKEQWNKLLHALNGISLSRIPELPSPTGKRSHDAAYHGSLIITTREGQSFQHVFDDEHPHEDLRPLMNELISLRESCAQKP